MQEAFKTLSTLGPLLFFSFPLKNYHLNHFKHIYIYSRERGRGGGETATGSVASVASCTCPDRGSNLWPFCVRDDAPTNWATLARAGSPSNKKYYSLFPAGVLFFSECVFFLFLTVSCLLHLSAFTQVFLSPEHLSRSVLPVRTLTSAIDPTQVWPLLWTSA